MKKTLLIGMACAALLASPAGAAIDVGAADAYISGRYDQAADLALSVGGADNLALAARALNARAYFEADRKTARRTAKRAQELAEEALERDPDHVEGRLQAAIAMAVRGAVMAPPRAFLLRLPSRSRQLIDEALARDADNPGRCRPRPRGGWKSNGAAAARFTAPTPRRVTKNSSRRDISRRRISPSPMNALCACSRASGPNGASTPFTPLMRRERRNRKTRSTSSCRRAPKGSPARSRKGPRLRPRSLPTSGESGIPAGVLTDPTRVYRLITAEGLTVARAAGVVPYAELDRRDGFFHLSTADQALETASVHFAGHTDLYALEIPLAGITEDVRFEPVAERGGAVFPHLYGELSMGAVGRVRRLRKGPDGAFVFVEDAV